VQQVVLELLILAVVVAEEGQIQEVISLAQPVALA